MYTPEAFREEDPRRLYAFARAHPFATVVTPAEESCHVSHLPLLVDPANGLLLGHLARANPHASLLADGAPVVAIFHGPHAYVSPSVYDVPGVPTWNYVAVHAHGRAWTLGEEGLRRVLDETVARFEPSDWRATVAPEVIETRLQAIVAFEIRVERLEGKWKMSQNRSARERERVAEWLEGRDADSREVAALMRARSSSSP